jgi:hypothetical protein
MVDPYRGRGLFAESVFGKGLQFTPYPHCGYQHAPLFTSSLVCKTVCSDRVCCACSSTIAQMWIDQHSSAAAHSHA